MWGGLMKFNIYDRFVLEIQQIDGGWAAWRLGEGRKRPEDLIIPPGFDPAGLITFLDDIYHEYARPGKVVTMLD